MPKWKTVVLREALTLDRIRSMPVDEVAAYFVTRNSDGLTAQEQALLSTWLATSDANRQALDGASRAWNALQGAEDHELVAAMRAHALAPRRGSRVAWRPLAAAATIAVVLGAVFFAPLWSPGGRPIPPVQPSAPITYASAVGKVQDIALPDGSRMTLDADSAAIGRFGAEVREIRLTRGRAFFAVAHDASRPFTVHAGGREIVDLGTRFDVNLGPEETTVTLVEGRLSVASADRSAPPKILMPGQQLVGRGDLDQIRVLGAGAGDATAWRTGRLYFDDQSLAEASAVMNRYSRTQIVIRDPRVAALRVTGQFKAGDAEAFAGTLAELYRLKSQRRADHIELFRDG